MPISHIDTFEHDVAEEIKSKDSSLTSIASSGGDVSNYAEKEEKTNTLLIIAIVIISLTVVCGLIYLGFTLYASKVTTTPKIEAIDALNTDDTSLLAKLSPQFPPAIERYVSNATKSPYGYTLFFSSYSSVFAYMLKNESLYADDIAKAVGSPRDKDGGAPAFVFTDLTINNQNMRYGKSASSTVIYAFISTKAIVIASTTEAILTLRGDILR